MKNLLAPAILFLAASAPGWAWAQEFPLTIEHKYGTTVIENKPERIATVDFTGADNLIALGVDPVTVRYFAGNYPRAVWPWADALMGADPEILRGELNFELIATTEPDIIIAIQSGISADDYAKLSAIAPVIAVPAGKGDYELSWVERALLAARAIGKEEEAQAQVEAIREKLVYVAATHPEWAGKTATVAFTQGGDRTKPGGHTSYDIRAQLLGEMGFTTPTSIDELTGDNYAFFVNLSAEEIGRLDADLVAWRHDGDDFNSIKALFGRERLLATQEARDIYMNAEVTAALAHASLLSLPFAIDHLVPMIEAALDGDPTTNADGRPDDLLPPAAR